MAPDPLDQLRLTLMQQLLPVGLAVADRVRRGGAAELITAFNSSQADPFEALRQEGEPAASRLRARLDQVSPGLGNPVVPVQVRQVDGPPDGPPASEGAGALDPDPQLLPARLLQIEVCLVELERRLAQDG